MEAEVCNLSILIKNETMNQVTALTFAIRYKEYPESTSFSHFLLHNIYSENLSIFDCLWLLQIIINPSEFVADVFCFALK